ncbi:hypothetical protein B5K05_07655 [Rhizobium phaseoli]|nr:hypothetical protein B5K04_07615 [Rhizobium phaseoli]RDJ17611.1 hypothetical protein B5K05_07655 [Rhizobium phaseoli]
MPPAISVVRFLTIEGHRRFPPAAGSQALRPDDSPPEPGIHRCRRRGRHGRSARPAPHPAAATFSPRAGRRGQVATSPSLASLSQGTSPLPVRTGRGLG